MKHSYRPGSRLLNETRLWIGILALLIFFITLAITVTIANVPLFMGSLWFSKSFEAVALSYWTVVDNYLQLLAYLNFPWIDTLVMSDFPTSASAAFHFLEVKHLFYLNYGVMAISALIGFYALHELKVTHNLWRLYWPFKKLRWLPIIVIILLVFNFNTIFIAFHEIAFNNDAWLFNPATDPIILVLHESFFLLSFVSVFLIVQLAIEWVYRIGKKAFNRQILGI